MSVFTGIVLDFQGKKILHRGINCYLEFFFKFSFLLRQWSKEALITGSSLYEIDLPGHKWGRGSWVLFMLFEHDYTAYQ